MQCSICKHHNYVTLYKGREINPDCNLWPTKNNAWGVSYGHTKLCSKGRSLIATLLRNTNWKLFLKIENCSLWCLTCILKCIPNTFHINFVELHFNAIFHQAQNGSQNKIFRLLKLDAIFQAWYSTLLFSIGVQFFMVPLQATFHWQCKSHKLRSHSSVA